MSAILPGVKFSQFIDGGNVQAGDQVAGLRNGLNTLFNFSSENGQSLSRQVTQNAHGFLLGQVLYMQGSGLYALASAAANLAPINVIGFVAAVIDANNFILQFGGWFNFGAALFAPGNTVLLSPTVAGGLTLIPSITPGQVNKILFVCDTASSGIWLNYPGLVV